MKCEVASNTTHNALISKEISYRSYKEICSGEPKKVNLGWNYEKDILEVENNTLVHNFRGMGHYIFGVYTAMAYDWEIFTKFFSIHNIEPNWLDCNMTWGWYDEDLGGWTGCMGKV